MAMAGWTSAGEDSDEQAIRSGHPKAKRGWVRDEGWKAPVNINEASEKDWENAWRERVEAWSIAAESPVAAPNGRTLWLVDIKRRGMIVRYCFKIQKIVAQAYVKSILIT